MPRLLTYLGILAFAFAVSGVQAADSPSLAVETSDGRELIGTMDDRTDEVTLWLRLNEDGISLSVPIAWNDVIHSSAGGEEMAVDELRQRREELASVGPKLSALETPVPERVVQAAFMAPRTPRVRNLEIVAAGLVNLDRDVEPDGLAVTIVAVGFDGAPVAVRGSFRAELHGERRSVEDPAPRFEELGRWTERVQSEDFVEGAATYCLPFRSVAPEWEFDIVPDAVVTVLLSASGHGNYSASAPVALRHFNPLRDELQQWQGTRFLPNEVRGEFRGDVRPGMWLWWGR